MKYKVGDLVIYIQNPQTVRRVRRVYGDMVLLWGFYDYVHEKDIKKVEVK
ncbi:hypothetical protein [Peptostreptococcus russellii]|uniref:Uncharacterized protein n=1 Tax=Peptostreptococcus russellii TaxID=215200 RepID=A0A1H8KWP2_9FIRM|nr:hypothetical protein [Peptostreptococcus russellii]SEN97360.1 hypothetical protein SAMN05216454_1497 [Peptostreptococcus russellii]